MSSNTVLSGSLKDFGLIEVLQVVELGAMTGAIQLKQQSTGRAGILYFNQGKMANCSELDPGALTLGDVLQQLRMATHQHIEQAFNQQLQDAFGKRIGERLVAMRVISDKQLGEALRTRALWTARELALWQDGTYEFIAGSNIKKLLPHGDPSLDIEVMRVTMEIVRYSDEWQELSPSLPQGMRTTLQMAPALHRAMRFDSRTIELLTHINLCRRVRRIATAVRRSELDVARDLAQLVQQQFVLAFAYPQDIAHPQHFNGNANDNGRSVRLPDPAEKLRLENFELLNLISRMETEWDRRRTPIEQLPALVEFVNWTMEALADACRKNGTELDPNTLQALLVNERLWHMGNYTFRIENNAIDVDNFTVLCRGVLSADMQKAANFYDEAFAVLQRILSSIFDSINARIANPHERLENQEVWEAMFEQFALHAQ